jgi:hypothetical protein
MTPHFTNLGLGLGAGTGTRHQVPMWAVNGIRLPMAPPDAGPSGPASVILASFRVVPAYLSRYYSRCYHFFMVTKRSVSLADEVATAVEEAAKQDGVSFSAWLSNAAEKQLQVRQGLRGVAAWEGETGSLSAEELAAGEALLARLRSGVSGVASRVRRR